MSAEPVRRRAANGSDSCPQAHGGVNAVQRHLIVWRTFGVMPLVVLAASFAVSNGQPGSSRITAYASGSSDNVALRTIGGARTGLGHPAGITLGGTSDLHVSNKANNSVTVYTRGARGNVAPRRIISGARTGLDNPRDVVLDSSGNLYVSNKNNSITVYPPKAAGNAPARRTISGTRTGLNDPEGVVLDPAGNLYVVNVLGNSVTVYAPSASGNAAPLRTISGSRTGLSNPLGVALDS